MVSFVIGRPASGKTYNVVRNEILKHEDSVILICLKKEFEYMDILDPSESFVKEEGDYQAVSWLHVNGSMEIRKYNEIFLDYENGESEAKMDEYKENILSMLREHKFSGTPLIVMFSAGTDRSLVAIGSMYTVAVILPSKLLSASLTLAGRYSFRLMISTRSLDCPVIFIRSSGTVMADTPNSADAVPAIFTVDLLLSTSPVAI